MASDQRASGSNIAQASDGSTAIVYVYQVAAPAEVTPEDAAEAENLVASMPEDTVPEPAALPDGSLVPWARNRRFVGRMDDLRTLAIHIKGGNVAAVGQSPAVTGGGGIGKSQLACEFAYRYGQFFKGGVFWLNFADPDAIPAEIARCGNSRALHLHSGFDSLPLTDQVGLVARAWHSDLPRLLIFDNCDDEAPFVDWCPRSGACRVLLTSRRSTWSGELGVSAVPLGILRRSESIELLSAHRPDLNQASEDLDAVAEELGDLPLALHLAGSFLARYRHEPFGQPAAYLDAIRRPDRLSHPSLTEGEASPTGHDQHVARTFGVSYERLDRDDSTDALAIEALLDAACMQPGEPISRWLLRRCLGIGENDENAGRRFADSVRRLEQLGLIDRSQEGGDLTLHRLVATFARDRTPEEEPRARNAVERALAEAAFEQIQQGLPAEMLAWQSHLRTVAETAVRTGSSEASLLLNALGTHLKIIADYDGAITAYERALAIDEETFHPASPPVARDVSNLGLVLHEKGDLDAAKAAFKRALRIDEQAFGPDNPNVAIRANNLGLVLLDQGQFALAKFQFERALRIDAQAFGSQSTEVAVGMNNLGRALYALGDFSGAKAAFEKALRIDERILGPNHLDLAPLINNVGSILHEYSDLEGATACYERALQIVEDAVGPDHPHVARALNNLGTVLCEKRDLNGAKNAFERALQIETSVYGSQHSDVARLADNLGAVLRAQGQLDRAEALVFEALRIEESASGLSHPNVAIRLNSLGILYMDKGDLANAKAAFERALRIDEQAFGADHPRVAKDVSLLGGILLKEHDLDGAEAAFKRALRIDEPLLGSDHPQVGRYINNLGCVLYERRDLRGARAAFERALQIFEAKLGAQHPETETLRHILRSIG